MFWALFPNTAVVGATGKSSGGWVRVFGRRIVLRHDIYSWAANAEKTMSGSMKSRAQCRVKEQY
jgi:hypothetical protein